MEAVVEEVRALLAAQRAGAPPPAGDCAVRDIVRAVALAVGRARGICGRSGFGGVMLDLEAPFRLFSLARSRSERPREARRVSSLSLAELGELGPELLFSTPQTRLRRLGFGLELVAFERQLPHPRHRISHILVAFVPHDCFLRPGPPPSLLALED